MKTFLKCLVFIVLPGMVITFSCKEEYLDLNDPKPPILPQTLACVDIQARPYINIRLIPVGKLSKKRSELAIAAAGAKIVFAGGV